MAKAIEPDVLEPKNIMQVDLGFTETLRWRMYCLLVRLANADLRGHATIADIKREARELVTHIDQEYGDVEVE